MAEKQELFKQWEEVAEKIRQPIEDKYNSNKPTERQQQAYIPYDEIIQKRILLPIGSQDRLLLMMYSEIPPVRSDYHKTRIFSQTSDQINVEDNYIILTDNPVLVLQKYKTKKLYGTLTINIPNTLFEEIKLSVEIRPREYLFVSPKSHQPFEKSNTFNQWVNRTLKKILDKHTFCLTMLRHIYISRRDLKLEEKSPQEQLEIARIMGHSIEEQDIHGINGSTGLNIPFKVIDNVAIKR